MKMTSPHEQSPSPEQGSPAEVLATLDRARMDLERALNLTALNTLIPRAARNELSSMLSDLERIIAGSKRALYLN